MLDQRELNNFARYLQTYLRLLQNAEKLKNTEAKKIALRWVNQKFPRDTWMTAVELLSNQSGKTPREILQLAKKHKVKFAASKSEFGILFTGPLILKGIAIIVSAIAATIVIPKIAEIAFQYSKRRQAEDIKENNNFAKELLRDGLITVAEYKSMLKITPATGGVGDLIGLAKIGLGFFIGFKVLKAVRSSK